jgi:hypothetical protein
MHVSSDKQTNEGKKEKRKRKKKKTRKNNVMNRIQ